MLFVDVAKRMRSENLKYVLREYLFVDVYIKVFDGDFLFVEELFEFM